MSRPAFSARRFGFAFPRSSFSSFSSFSPRRLAALALWCGLLLHAQSAVCADAGVTASSIKLGQSAPFSGVIGSYGREFSDGANAYFAHVNAAGGVLGRKIELVSLDDGYVPARTRENVEKLLDEHQAFAVFGVIGTGTTQEGYKVAAARKVPMVGVVSGSDFLKDAQAYPYLFIPRAGHRREIEVLVNQSVTLGLGRIAAIYQNDGYGRSCLESFNAVMAAKGLKPVLALEIDRVKVDGAGLGAKVKAAAPQTVLLFSTAKPAAQAVGIIRAAGVQPRFMALSPVDAQAVIGEIGAESARGIGITQIVPYPWNAATPLTREYQERLQRYGKQPPSFFSLEGYIAAKQTVGALKRAGGQLTREGFLRALNATGTEDLGGYRVRFGDDDRRGSDFVELTLIGPNGKVVR